MTYRIAVIEDNPADTFLLEEVLQRAKISYLIDSIEDGEQAISYIQAIETNRPDLFLLDLNLPKVNGADILHLITQHSFLADVPVIVWSSGGFPKDQSEIVHSRATCFVAKPNSLEGFMAIGVTIRKVLSIPE